MRNIIISILLLGCILYACSNDSNNDKNVLIPEFDFNYEMVDDVESLFQSKPKYTYLETDSVALVGRIGKIIKRNGYFFILSGMTEILQFDEKGRFISKLSRLGQGPEEYSMITDIDIYIDKNKEPQIWVGDYKWIRKYALKDNRWKQIGIIKYDYVVNKLRIVNNDKLLLLTAQNEEILTLSDMQGKALKTFFKGEFPFVHGFPVQFKNFDDKFVFMKASSNSCIVFDENNNSFVDSKIVNQDEFISPNVLLELYNKYDIEYFKYLKNYNRTRIIRKVKNRILFEFILDNKRYIVVIDLKDHSKRCLQYNIDDKNWFIAKIIYSDSKNSFLTAKEQDNEDNPIIIEY